MKPGATDESVEVDGCRGSFAAQVADPGDAVAADEQVGGGGRVARAVVDGSITEEGCGHGLTFSHESLGCPSVLVIEVKLPRGNCRGNVISADWRFAACPPDRDLMKIVS